MKSVHLVSLGCPKNRVDSEVMLGILKQDGCSLVGRPEDADVIVVNTCSFIDASKEESIETIMEMARHRTGGSCQKLVVTGCMAQRYPDAIRQEIPEVDEILGTGEYARIGTVVSEGLVSIGTSKARPPVRAEHFSLSADLPRVATSPSHSQYLKIAEGCSNACTFCIIPALRGPQVSRPVADIVREAERLVGDGARELNLIAQDLTAYGYDLTPRTKLARLLRALEHVEGLRWVRLLYCYPRAFGDDLVGLLRDSPVVVPYVDMPLQHISDRILRRMKRGKGEDGTRELLLKLRAELPDLTLRTTFIVGFPGETDADFDKLCGFVREVEFDHVGVFRYSHEEGTPSYDMDGQVDDAVKQERYDTLMGLQHDIVRRRQAARVGTRVEVMVEGVSEESELLLQGRHAGQAPGIDGCVYITSAPGAQAGDILELTVEQAGPYDLVAGA